MAVISLFLDLGVFLPNYADMGIVDFFHGIYLKASLCALLAMLSVPYSAGDDFCHVSNTAFQNGENLNFRIYYSLAGIYFSGGEASFSVKEEQWNGKEVYHIVGAGKTNSFVDKTFKVRDRYETFIDTGTLRPYKFIRNVHEGGTKIFEDVTFIKTANTAVTDSGVYKVPVCVQDVVSAIYSARNIDFSRYKPGDKIPFSMFLQNKTYDLYMHYIGKEIVKTKRGKFNAIKFKPLLIKGTIFESGEKMTIWISDDVNHIPLRVESPIIVGKVSVELIGFQNLRNELKPL